MGLGSIGERLSSLKQSVVDTASRAEKAVEQKVAEVKTQVADTFTQAPAAPPVAAPPVQNAIGLNPKTYTVDELKRGLGTTKEVWNGPNTSRAIATELDLAKLKLTNPRQMGRLDDDIQSALTRGVAMRRTDSDRGQSGFLGQAQAHRAGEAVMGMGDAHHAELKTLLKDAGDGPDGDAKRAVILKAVAARKEALTGDDVDKANAAMAEVKTFAGDIKGMNRDELAKNTTSLDLDNQNRSGTTPDGKADAQVDNDGFVQKFENSCVPSVGQMARAEQDPVFALALNKEQGGLTNTDTNSASAKEQSWVLRNGDKFDVLQQNSPVPRTEKAAHEKLFDQIDASSGYTDLEKKILKNELRSDKTRVPLNPNEQKVRDQVLPKFKAATGMSDADIKRHQYVDGSSGMTAESGSSFGANSSYKEHVFGDFALGDIRSEVTQGRPVPLNIEYAGGGGHQLLISDARDGQLLISDPYTGKTAWVKERDVVDGTFINSAFGLGQGKTKYWYKQD